MLIKEKILLDSKVVQTSGNIVSDMDGEKVMLNIDNGNYYNLGEIGGIIWEMIKEPISIERLIYMLMEEFDVEKKDCERHVISFLTNLSSERLIKVLSR